MNNFFKILVLFLVNYCEIISFSGTQDSWAQKTLSKLTLREKIGQMFVVAATSAPEILQEKLASGDWENVYNLDQDYIKKLITEYKIGGLIFLYGNTPLKQLEAIREYQQLSDTPLLITQDCEWGINMRHKEAIKYPRNLTLGAIQDKNKIYELGKEIARQCKLVGVHMNFSPVVDCNNNPANPVIHDRSFGDDPNLVAEYGNLMMRGLQDEGVLACAKHFPGHGDTDVDSHLDLPIIKHDISRLENLELVPFKKLIDSGVSSIMLAHMNVPALDDKNITTFSYKIVTELLEKKLNFNGLKITDALGMGALTKYYEPGEIELKAFLAGFDILLCPLDVPKSVDLIEKVILSGQVSEAELDRRVLKILNAKSISNKLTKDANLLEQINTQYAKDLKANLYQEAITILKDPENLIPICCPLENFPDPKFWTSLGSSDLKENLWVFESCVVASIFDINKFASKNFGVSEETISDLRKIKESGKKLVVILYGTPYSAKLFDFADAIIIAYENDPDSINAVEKILSGECKAIGKMPINF